MAKVLTTDIRNTILLQIPNGNIAFRILKSDYDRKDSITCPANSMTYPKKDLKVVKTGE